MKLLALAAAAALAAVAGIPAHEARTTAPAPRLVVVGHAAAPRGYSGDVYGYRGHAYLSSHKGAGAQCPAEGVRVFSLRRPSRPARVAVFGRVAGTWTEKTIVKHVAGPAFTGDVAVTSFQACRRGAFEGFGVYDVTTPARPRKLALVRTWPRGSHEIWLWSGGGKAYVYTAIEFSEVLGSPDGGRSPGPPGFRTFDVSDPRRPREVGGWGAWKELSIRPGRDFRDFTNTNFVHSVITNRSGTRAFVSYWDLGTVILDIRDPTRPRYLGRTSFPPGADGNAHSASLDASERLLVETDEATGGKPRLYDIADPRAPRHLVDFSLPRNVLVAGHRGGTLERLSGIDLTDSVHDSKIVGKRALFSWYSQGVVLADVSDPVRPRFLARFRPPPGPDRYGLLCPGRRCTAVWGVFPLGRYVLASDMLSGLWVLRIR